MRIMAGIAHNLAPAIADQPHSVKLRAPSQTPIADQHFERRMFSDGILVLPDGARLPYWGFEDPLSHARAKLLPSPIIRMREGETAQVRLETLKCAGTGAARVLSGFASNGASNGLRVAHFDTHIYQWQPREAGTWLYQSHAGTAHDFEMGLFGLLVVDPAPDVSGRPLAYKNGPSYDREQVWVLDDVDSTWHRDAALVTAATPFTPDYFLVNGIANTEILHHRDVAISARSGEKVLIRLLNASYSLVKVSIEHFQGSIVSVDGTAIDTSKSPWTSWIPVQPDRPFFMATGSRHDLMIDLDPVKNPAIRGQSYKVTFEFLELAKRSVRNFAARELIHVGRAETTITVA
jgi:FtsP/CotA-like multicopper oxidase with cupredoxin domain